MFTAPSGVKVKVKVKACLYLQTPPPPPLLEASLFPLDQGTPSPEPQTGTSPWPVRSQTDGKAGGEVHVRARPPPNPPNTSISASDHPALTVSREHRTRPWCHKGGPPPGLDLGNA